MLNASPRFYWSIILFTIFLQNTTKCDSYFIITKYDKVWLLFYYKVRQNATIILLQNVIVLQQNATVSTNATTLFQNVTVIAKCYLSCKMHLYTWYIFPQNQLQLRLTFSCPDLVINIYVSFSHTCLCTPWALLIISDIFECLMLPSLYLPAQS